MSSPHSAAIERMQQKQASNEEMEELTEEQQLEEAMVRRSCQQLPPAASRRSALFLSFLTRAVSLRAPADGGAGCGGGPTGRGDGRGACCPRAHEVR